MAHEYHFFHFFAFIGLPDYDMKLANFGFYRERKPGGTQQRFIWGGPVSRSKPLPF